MCCTAFIGLTSRGLGFAMIVAGIKELVLWRLEGLSFEAQVQAYNLYLSP